MAVLTAFFLFLIIIQVIPVLAANVDCPIYLYQCDSIDEGGALFFDFILIAEIVVVTLRGRRVLAFKFALAST